LKELKTNYDCNMNSAFILPLYFYKISLSKLFILFSNKNMIYLIIWNWIQRWFTNIWISKM